MLQSCSSGSPGSGLHARERGQRAPARRDSTPRSPSRYNALSSSAGGGAGLNAQPAGRILFRAGSGAGGWRIFS